jgi:nucleotide sugar dehydrogenase
VKVYGRRDVKSAFRDGVITVAIYGLGKMGLPLAAVFADKGAKVVGVDVNEEVVRNVNLGQNHVQGEQGLDELIKTNISRGRIEATTDGVEAARRADVMIIIVPAFLDESKKADLRIVTSVAQNISKGLKKDDVVIIETTVPPGTTEDIIRPILEESGLKAGVDFGLAHCPERTSSGRAIVDIMGAYPKVVGGVDKKSTDAAVAIYSVINERGVIPVSNSRTAEMVKIAEGLHRDVNIALANELALISNESGVDVWEVIEVANTDPNCNLHEPGAGVGGHCIPVYPWLVINGNGSTRLIKTAREVNDSMSSYVVDKVSKELDKSGREIKGSNILVAGLVYRAGVKETYNSPARRVIRDLRALGANVFGYDPVLNEDEMKSLLNIESPNGNKVDCTVFLHNRNYKLESDSGNRVTPMNMFK